MKSEQLRVVEAFVQGSDVFAILPTGYLRLSMAIFKAIDGYRAKWLFLINVGILVLYTAILITSLHSCSTNRE